MKEKYMIENDGFVGYPERGEVSISMENVDL